MAYDLVIKNGTVVDGSGSPRRLADIGVRDGKIVETGRVAAGSARVIDAEGKIVAPGFIDLHTHYDAQLFWDPLATSSCWHGFTTVAIGNCGFTLAPCRVKDRAYITGMFARVEGMNRKALEEGIPWEWESFPEYLDRMDRGPLGMNVISQVGHSGVRRFVMGEEANTRAATEDEIVEMKRQVREALAAGALGFSTSMSGTHNDWSGNPVPSRLGTRDETLELGSLVGEINVGSIEMVGGGQALMEEMALRSRRPVNWNELSHGWEQPEAWKGQLAFMDQASQKGAQIYAIARSYRLDQTFNFRSPATVQRYGAWKRWFEVLSQPPEKKLELLNSPAVRAEIKAEVDAPDAARLPFRRLENVAFLKSKTGKYASYEGMSLGQISQKLARHPVDVAIDWSIEEGMQAEFGFIGTRNGDLAAVAHIIGHPLALPGISDAGASVERFNGTYFSTQTLGYWTREKKVLTLEDAVRRLTSLPASVYGVRDRGLLREGMAADIVIFDYDRLAWSTGERVNDLPAGQGRIISRAEGYNFLIVNGQVTLENGKHTGALSGRLLRSRHYRS